MTIEELKKLMMLMSVALLALGASAATENVDGVTWSYSVSGGKASVSNGSYSLAIPAATTGALIVPSTLGGYSATSIGSCAFYGCSGLTSETIPEGVTSVGVRRLRTKLVRNWDWRWRLRTKLVRK